MLVLDLLLKKSLTKGIGEGLKEYYLRDVFKE